MSLRSAISSRCPLIIFWGSPAKKKESNALLFLFGVHFLFGLARKRISVCGTRQKLRLTAQSRFLPTAAPAATLLHLPLAAQSLATFRKIFRPRWAKNLNIGTKFVHRGQILFRTAGDSCPYDFYRKVFDKSEFAAQNLWFTWAAECVMI